MSSDADWKSFELLRNMCFKYEISKQQSNEGMLLSPLQQGFLLFIVIVPRNPFTKYEVDRVGNNKAMRVCSLLPWQQGLLSNQVKRCIGLVPRDLCTKYKVDMLPNSKVIGIYLCCRGNKVSLTRTHGIDRYCHKGHVYQT